MGGGRDCDGIWYAFCDGKAGDHQKCSHVWPSVGEKSYFTGHSENEESGHGEL